MAQKPSVDKKSDKAKTQSKTKANASPAKTSSSKSPKLAKPDTPAKSEQKPIELFYWPTPNGWKATIMLEECGLPYTVIPVNISGGEQFKRKFLSIAPNNRIPAIVDPDGPGGKPISIFESGAILQYLGRKTGKLYPSRERERVEVEQWLFWQMSGLGPMAGQAHHFRQYAQKKVPYAIERYTDEVHRLYGVMNRRLKDRDFLASRYSIADIACWGWVLPHKNQGQDLNDFPNLKAWFERIGSRPAVKRGFAVGLDLRRMGLGAKTKEAAQARSVLFNQRGK
jgi:GSH-dependent disulfide-bond oxidoreductase